MFKFDKERSKNGNQRPQILLSTESPAEYSDIRDLKTERNLLQRITF